MHSNDSGWYLTGFLQGVLPVDMLLDTGATFSLLPTEIFELLPDKPALEQIPGCRLTGFTGEKAEVEGSVILDFGTSKHNWKVRFLVASGVKSCILGAEFLKEQGVRMDYAQGMIWCNQSYSTMTPELEKSATAKIVTPHDLRPRSEGIVEVVVESFPPGSTVIVEGTVEDLEKGFVVANSVISLDKEGKGMIRIMNPMENPLTVQPCEVGKVSMVTQVQEPHPLV